MERLEAAMVKARAARNRGSDASLPGSDPQGAPGQQAAASAPGSGNWLALPEIDIPPQLARRKRLNAILGAEFSSPFDILRSRVVRQMQEAGWKRLAVTSPTTQCGKSTISLNLALSLARYGQLRIVLMDFDLRRPAIATMLDRQRAAPSIVDLLRGGAQFGDLAVRYGPNLAICSNRTAVSQSAELLQNEETAAVLDRIEAEWQPDIMIFDTPPMRGNDDNLGFLGRMDCALIVAAAGSSTLPQIDRSEREVGHLTNVLGTVLNKCRYPDSTTGFDHSYYYG
ncbi:MAG: CpsD/CapB family tyrosine-protein kinase [Cypionkella sp.]